MANADLMKLARRLDGSIELPAWVGPLLALALVRAQLLAAERDLPDAFDDYEEWQFQRDVRALAARSHDDLVTMDVCDVALQRAAPFTTARTEALRTVDGAQAYCMDRIARGEHA